MDDAHRWAAVVRRDAAFDGHFVYCVKSTKIFCRPICKARLARRMNVEFCDTPAQAQARGYRPCKRCQPLLASYNPEADKIQKACDLLRALPGDSPLPGLERLAKEAGLTKHHFHRLFKRETGQTPREYALASRSGKASGSGVGSVLTPATPITPITNSSDDMAQSLAEEGLCLDWGDPFDERDLYGYDLIGYTLDGERLAKELPLAQVEVLVIYFSIVETTFGNLLVAFQGERVCKLELGSGEAELMASLETSFPSMYYIHSHASLAAETEALAYQQRVNAVVDALEFPSRKVLDVPFSLETDEGNALT